MNDHLTSANRASNGTSKGNYTLWNIQLCVWMYASMYVAQKPKPSMCITNSFRGALERCASGDHATNLNVVGKSNDWLFLWSPLQSGVIPLRPQPFLPFKTTKCNTRQTASAFEYTCIRPRLCSKHRHPRPPPLPKHGAGCLNSTKWLFCPFLFRQTETGSNLHWLAYICTDGRIRWESHLRLLKCTRQEKRALLLSTRAASRAYFGALQTGLSETLGWRKNNLLSIY